MAARGRVLRELPEVGVVGCQTCTHSMLKKCSASKNQSLIFVRKSLNDGFPEEGVGVAVEMAPPPPSAWISEGRSGSGLEAPRVHGTTQLINSRIPWKRVARSGRTRTPFPRNFIEEYERASLPNFHSAEFALRVKDLVPPRPPPSWYSSP